MKEVFFNSLQTISPLSKDTIDAIDKCLAAAHYAKGSAIVKEGALSDKMFFVLKGAVRAYYFHQDKEYTDWFVFENMFMCSLLAFFGGMPSVQCIEALEPSDMLILTRTQINQLCDKYNDMQRLNSCILTQSLITLQQNIIDHRFKTAPERYANLIETYPQVIQRVPLKYVASYLGVTQETLSRIRASAIN
ncbi:MAG: hypothetical protein JWP88_1000 [Flaviaesturariibacter sp.]|nr:hypothetical protein [Flaviaesturariibacter sp.]